MFIQRVWDRASNSSCPSGHSGPSGKGEWIIWDAGNEFWEMKGDLIRHFSIVSRVKDETTIVETVRLLNDSPIPLEAIRQEVRGWKVNEKVLPSVGMRAQVPPSSHSPSKHSPSRQMPSGQMPPSKQMPSGHLLQKRVSQPLRQGPAFLPDTPEDVSEHPPPPSQSHEPLLHKNTKTTVPMSSTMSTTSKKEDMSEGSLPMFVPETLVPTSLEEQSKQSSYTPPNNIWSSLSQWIPPSALFQPSLHHQAFLELSGTQDRSCLEKKDLEEHSQKREVRSQYVRHSQHSKPYRPKISGPSKQVSTGPLFI